MSENVWNDLKPVWTPPDPEATAISKYRHHVERKFGVTLRDSRELQRWSIRHHQEFWLDLYGHLKMIPPLPPGMKKAYDDTVPMSRNPCFFEGHLFNYTENVLREDHDPESLALIGLREGEPLDDGGAGERVTRRELRERVRATASALKRSGVAKGDRVAALVSNSVWAVVLYLASASMGAVFTCMSPDLGTEGCVSRLAQVTPTILFCDGDVTYKGKRSSTVAKIESILARLTQKPQVYVIQISVKQDKYPLVEDFLARSSSSDELVYTRVPFNYPVLICYSSGTTGAPKCIVHAHGVLLNLKKVAVLTSGMVPGNVALQYTTTSWIMFYILNAQMSTGATAIAYDGSPMYPDVRQLLRIVEKFGVTNFGSSPRYLAELEINNVVPKKEFDLSKLRVINTTGAPLATDQYYWFYSNFPSIVHLNNSAGGTETGTAFVGGDLATPVCPGEMQMAYIGIDADVADAETGDSIIESGQFGELIVRKPFSSQPAFFWGDKDGSIYKAAYFERFEKIDVWTQHDWVAVNPKTKNWVMSGRSDGVLNPSGIRFGSGEIYAIVEGPEFNSEISQTLCVGRRRNQDRDEQVFLFVRMIEGKVFTEQLKQRIRQKIIEGLSHRHVPKFILEVKDIPTTINGKKVEIAVKKILSGQHVKASSTIANPESLQQFKAYVNLEAEARQSKL